jgi:hypothetical protein
MIIPPNAVVSPALFAVNPADIAPLTARVSVPNSLISFWEQFGCGLFDRSSTDEPLHDGVSNRLLGPDEVLELFDSMTLDLEEFFKVGLPFFAKYDREFLMLAPDGAVLDVTALGVPYTVASDLTDFFNKLLVDPIFYEGISPS